MSRVRRAAAAATAAAAMGAALVLAGSTAEAASLSLSPSQGLPGESFAVSYAYGHVCSSDARIVVTWGGRSGAVIGSAPPDDLASCSLSDLQVTPPILSALSQPGPHAVDAAVVTRSGILKGSSAEAVYVVVPAAVPMPSALFSLIPLPIQTPRPATRSATPAPAAVSTPRSTPTLFGTFPPNDCVNGVPDVTPCPSPTAVPAAVAPIVRPTRGGVGAGPVILAALALLLVAGLASAAAAGLRTGASAGRRRRGLARTPIGPGRRTPLTPRALLGWLARLTGRV